MNTRRKDEGFAPQNDFKRGDFVVNYVGRLLSREAGDDKEKEYSWDHNIGSYMFWFQSGRHGNFVLDATEETNHFGRLVNHNVDGNCRRVSLFLDGSPRLFFQARRDIEVGEEIEIDYMDRRAGVLRENSWMKKK